MPHEKQTIWCMYPLLCGLRIQFLVQCCLDLQKVHRGWSPLTPAFVICFPPLWRLVPRGGPSSCWWCLVPCAGSPSCWWCLVPLIICWWCLVPPDDSSCCWWALVPSCMEVLMRVAPESSLTSLPLLKCSIWLVRPVWVNKWVKIRWSGTTSVGENVLVVGLLPVLVA